MRPLRFDRSGRSAMFPVRRNKSCVALLTRCVGAMYSESAATFAALISSNVTSMANTNRARKEDRVTLNHGDVTRIAREIGRSPSHVWRVIARERPSKTVAAQVAKVVGVPFDRIHLAA